jgi:hypothetical protein
MWHTYKMQSRAKLKNKGKIDKNLMHQVLDISCYMLPCYTKKKLNRVEIGKQDLIMLRFYT